MDTPPKIFELVERFERNITAYRSGNYNETQLRREFIDPFFIELGWDVNNVRGHAEAYKDVIHEDSIKVGGATKAPDYCFRIGGTRKFFLEAKKPSFNIRDDIHPALQLRRYAWSAKLPLSILTDFEEFAVYDCRMRPKQGDPPSKARIKYIKYTEYPEKWREIASIFDKKEIKKGSFDRFAESTRGKRGTAEVDSAFLAEIESWRDILARNIALRNPISQRELNFAVQRTIDRIIFLRICEDRGVETLGQLQGLMNGGNVYQRLCAIFYKADVKYNSGLFHFRYEREVAEPPDELTPSLIIDDKTLKIIIKSLYYPDSPYEFSVFPADILGQVYEQFLGKVIRLTPAHLAKVDDKPEVKKAGGVYYTPTYIVDYIVKNTVEKLVEGKTPNQAAKLRILDPACGSGSFLIGAYQYLLDWHRDWYIDNQPEKWSTGRNPRLYQAANGEWKLTTSERKRILLNNIYGVDIDRQAVEVTKLSLLLKVLEGENQETIQTMLRLFRERALPNLADNIKCGNSLIGSDFYQGQQLNLLDEEERYRINVFDWEIEFKEIMDRGGFDAVIGNPPWGSKVVISKDYFNKKYINRSPCSSAYFLEIALKHSKELVGFIVPKTISYYSAWKTIRNIILDDSIITKVLNTGIAFPNVNLESIVLILNKKDIKASTEIFYANPIKRPLIPKEIKYKGKYNREIQKIANIIPFISISENELKLLLKLHRNSLKIADIAMNIFRGLYIPDSEKRELQKGKTKFINKVPDVKRYFLKEIWNINIDRNEKWVAKAKQIMVPRVFIKVLRGNRLVSYPDIKGEYLTTEKLVNLIIEKKKYPVSEYFISGLINSKLLSFYVEKIIYSDTTETSRVMDRIYLNHLIIPKINLSLKQDKAKHDRMVSLVEQMLTLHKQLSAAKTPHEKIVIQRQIDAADQQIDGLVYELYELTEEEIKIVEEG